MPYISLLRQQTNSILRQKQKFSNTKQIHQTQTNEERFLPCPILRDHAFKPVIKRYCEESICLR
jgi:hypothetical protein